MNNMQNKQEDSQVDTQTEPEKGSSLLNEFASTSEDLPEILMQNWKNLLGGLLIVVLAYWLYNGYVTANENKLAEASERFQHLRSLYVEIVENPKDQEKITKLNSEIGLIKEKFADTSYAELARAYENASKLHFGKFDEVISSLKEKDFSRYTEDKVLEEVGADSMLKQMALEVDAISLARAMYLKSDNSKESKNADTEYSRKLFKGVAKNGNIFNLEALKYLGIYSINSSEKKELEEVKDALSKSRPELAQYLRDL